VINADGSNLKRLRPIEFTPGVYSGSYDSPAWSPDGKRLAYVKQDEEGIDTVYVMNADGTAETTLTNTVPVC
jgi:Tol biopolymer transport system component